jgi:hypothetical protein
VEELAGYIFGEGANGIKNGKTKFMVKNLLGLFGFL